LRFAGNGEFWADTAGKGQDTRGHGGENEDDEEGLSGPDVRRAWVISVNDARVICVNGDTFGQQPSTRVSRLSRVG
jgi:hypothetical protein